MTTKTASPVQRMIVLAIALIVIGAAYLLVPSITNHVQPMRRVISFLFMAWAVLFCTQSLLFGSQLLHLMLSRRIARGDASSLVVSLHDIGVLGTLWDIYRRRRFPKVRLPIVFAIWSIVILGIALGISLSGRLEDSELRFLRKEDMILPEDSLSCVNHFILSTADNNPLKYLRDLATLVPQFKKMGARVVVAERPFLSGSLLTPLSARAIEEGRALVDSIEQSGVVVFYDNATTLPIFGSRQEGSPGSPRLAIAKPYSYWRNPMSQFLRDNSVRWLPVVSRGELVANPALAAVAKYRGVTGTLLPVQQSHSVTYGDISIPVQANGEAISLWGVHYGGPLLGVSAERGLDSDTLRFIGKNCKGGIQAIFPLADAKEVRDKIILIDWWNGAQFLPFLTANEQEVIIESLLRGRVLAKYEWLPLPLTAVMIALAALLCFRVRPGIAVPVLLVLALLLFAASSWALITHHVLLNMSYPAIALVLSAVIFPLARQSHEAY